VKITAVETIHVRVPLSRPTGPAGVFNAARQTIVVRIATDEGITGWGETYAMPGVRAAIDQALGPLLVGADPCAVRRLHRVLRTASFDNGLAVGGVDIALHDVWGKAVGSSIAGLYGGSLRPSVPAYASGFCYQEGLEPAATWPGEAERLVCAGYGALKLRVGQREPEQELPLLERIREQTPAAVRLMVDAWGAYTHGEAVRMGRALERLGFDWFEEPLPQAGYAGYPELAGALDIPIAGGESLQTRAAFAALLQRRAVDIVQPDVAICGGIADALFVAELAAQHGVVCAPHTWNGGIMHAASLHVAALLPEPTHRSGRIPAPLEYDTTENPLITGLLAEPPRLVDGSFDVPTAAGLGVTIDEPWIRAHAVEL